MLQYLMLQLFDTFFLNKLYYERIIILTLLDCYNLIIVPKVFSFNELTI